MTPLAGATADLFRMATSGTPVAFEDVQAIAARVVEAGGMSDEADRTKAIGDLVEAILAAPPLRSALVALTCGALVEQGAHPYVAVHAIITRLGGILGDASGFVTACYDRADEGDPDPIATHGPDVTRTDARGAEAYAALDLMLRPAISMLARSPRARRAAHDEGRMVSRLKRFPGSLPMIDWLRRLLAVLDDADLLVFHPETYQGWRVEMSGIASNAQLLLLLENVLVRAGLPGERPPEDVVRAAVDQVSDPPPYRFQVGLATVDGEPLPLEGFPAEIPLVEGERVVRLEPVPDPRVFRVTASFDGLHADLRVSSVLTAAAVLAWFPGS